MKEKQRLPTFSAIFKNKKQSSDALCKGNGSGDHQGNDDEQRLADNAVDGAGTDGNDNKVSFCIRNIKLYYIFITVEFVCFRPIWFDSYTVWCVFDVPAQCATAM